MLILINYTKLYIHFVTLICNIKHTQDKDQQKVWQTTLLNLGAGITLVFSDFFFLNVYYSAKQTSMNQLFFEFTHNFSKAYLDDSPLLKACDMKDHIFFPLTLYNIYSFLMHSRGW